jgi:lipid-binding SYLF domain-containing protein
LTTTLLKSINQSINLSIYQSINHHLQQHHRIHYITMLKRWTLDASNALEDAYGQWVLGDDAGKSARLVLVVPPSYSSTSTSTFTSTSTSGGGLNHNHNHSNSSVGGLQFVNVQGRPYVSLVEPGSLAEQAGVQVRDAVHYAAMVEEDWQGKAGDNDYTKYQPLVTHALHQESKGNRISYDDLRHLLIQRRTERALTTDAPIPSTIHTTKATPLQQTTTSSPKPICFLFRRTKQRRKNTTTKSTLSLPTHFPLLFRLDDECDAAANMVQKLIAASPADPLLCQLLSQAVGIAFLRVQKILFGLSAHCGSGLVVARLEDGTWSAPSAIASYGMGVGLQLGVETSGYLLLLNSPQALKHFSAGTSFSLSANLFSGLGGWLGLEPYTYTQAASLPSTAGASWCGPNIRHNMNGTGILLPNDDEYNDLESTVPYTAESSSNTNTNTNTNGSSSPNSMNNTSVAAPMVAYAVTAQGLSVGVSLEGSRICSRSFLNRGVTSAELLTGKLTTPKEAEPLYQALYQLEYQYECRQLPPTPKLQPPPSDTMQPLDDNGNACTGGSGWRAKDVPIDDLDLVTVQKFQDWLQGGVPIRTTTMNGGGGGTSASASAVKTLWLSTPKTTTTASSHDHDHHNRNGASRNCASLRLGLVHTPQDSQIMDDADGGGTVASEDVTLDSALLDNKVRDMP